MKSKIKRVYLVQKRKEMKLSQEEAALILGISRQYYSSIENGWKRPSSHLAKKIANCFRFENEWYKLLE